MSKTKHDLLVVAHPDDETIFFGALLLSRRKRPWHVVCVTDADAEGMGRRRHRQFIRACKLLGVARVECLGFPDIFEQRLDLEQLEERLTSFMYPSCPTEVFTHGVLGEYGHPHHQDVSFAVHTVFHDRCPVYSSAYNCFPDLLVRLTRARFEMKAHILSEIYGSETTRFANLLPATSCEGFTRVGIREIRALYTWFRHGKKPRRQDLLHYSWLYPFLKSNPRFAERRLF